MLLLTNYMVKLYLTKKGTEEASDKFIDVYWGSLLKSYMVGYVIWTALMFIVGLLLGVTIGTFS